MSVRVCAAVPQTQWDLFPRVGRQEEHEQSEGGDQDAWDEQVEAVVERPSSHHHREGDVRVGLIAAFVKTLVPSTWYLCEARKKQMNKQKNIYNLSKQQRD